MLNSIKIEYRVRVEKLKYSKLKQIGTIVSYILLLESYYNIKLRVNLHWMQLSKLFQFGLKWDKFAGCYVTDE